MMNRKPKPQMITADYVNGLLHDIVRLKTRIKNLEAVDQHVRRLLNTAVADDNFPAIKADLELALKDASVFPEVDINQSK